MWFTLFKFGFKEEREMAREPQFLQTVWCKGRKDSRNMKVPLSGKWIMYSGKSVPTLRRK
jgi:hypothetical protein